MVSLRVEDGVLPASLFSAMCRDEEDSPVDNPFDMGNQVTVAAEDNE